MRLTAVLLEHPLCATPTTHALAALMCFNAARLPTRTDASGDLRPLFDQDRAAWDRQLIGEGMLLLDQSAEGARVSKYHLEAAIAKVHPTAGGIDETEWGEIVSL